MDLVLGQKTERHSGMRCARERDLSGKQVSVMQGMGRYYLENLVCASTLSTFSFQVRLCQEEEDLLSLL